MDVGKITQQITEIEKRTNAELVAAIMPTSGTYNQARWRFAILAAMIITFIVFVYLDQPYHDLAFVFTAQLALVYFGLYVAKLPFILRHIMTAPERHEQLQQSTAACFYQHGLHRTKNQNGILIYVSLLERQVEILADKGIAEKVPQSFWQGVVNDMLPLIRQGNITQAVEQALQRCAEPLQQHFPKSGDDANELPNRPITS